MYLKAPEAGGETAFPRAARSAAEAARIMAQGKLLPYGLDSEQPSELMCGMPSTFKVTVLAHRL